MTETQQQTVTLLKSKDNDAQTIKRCFQRLIQWRFCERDRKYWKDLRRRILAGSVCQTSRQVGVQTENYHKYLIFTLSYISLESWIGFIYLLCMTTSVDLLVYDATAN